MNEKNKIISEIVSSVVLFIFGVFFLVWYFLEPAGAYIAVPLVLMGAAIGFFIYNLKKLKKLILEEKKYKSDDFKPTTAYEQVKYDIVKGKIKERFSDLSSEYEVSGEDTPGLPCLSINLTSPTHSIYIDVYDDGECDYILHLNEDMENALYEYVSEHKEKYTEETLDELLFGDNMFTVEFDNYISMYEKFYEIISLQQKIYEELEAYYNEIKLLGN